MFLEFLDPALQKFIDANIGTDVSKLALQKNPFPEYNWIEIINQIAAKSKAKEKLPTWYNATGIIYPSKISVEQTSSEKTALYKSSLVSGDRLIDLTGGFGVDDYYFSKVVKQVTHCEINEELSTIVKHNCEVLNATNIQCIADDSTNVLETLNQQWDWIYIDPSRRSDSKGKVFLLEDCLPNVPDLQDFYFRHTSNILIKTAPILDLSAGISALNHVQSIHIVAVDNEVKELLWQLSKGYTGDIEIKTLNFAKDTVEQFDWKLGNETDHASFSLPLTYLYEPNSAIMKSGAFEAISAYYQIDKLHQHSHLYTSQDLIDFPGRVFKIVASLPYQKNEMKEFFVGQKANITTRNFPDRVEDIRKKWKIKDGGDRYCFFTTDLDNNKIVLICTKIK
ncbi:THUMP-like domain-containing protein [Flavobacterium sp. '19STA2R22 D10 B1']|uniref:THUMP-like domain-containing protein n=1 Tax=Flavobacterium aerium TaxID=3037261 RepID=UPI00278C1271|nr:class I SAM-dependent methyltransferase [Flavobacterium sp. '19STA2R22 D10 B1']